MDKESHLVELGIPEKKLSILQQVRKEAWDEIMFRRNREHLSLVWVASIMTALVAAYLSRGQFSLIISFILTLLIVVLVILEIIFIYRTHKHHEVQMKLLKIISDIFLLSSNSEYKEGTILFKEIDDLRKENQRKFLWGPSFHTITLVTIGIFLIFLVWGVHANRICKLISCLLSLPQ